jgi:hypothetical protein
MQDNSNNEMEDAVNGDQQHHNSDLDEKQLQAALPMELLHQ